jgi:hypothetical protein
VDVRSRHVRLVFAQRARRAIGEQPLDAQQVRQVRRDRPALAFGDVAKLFLAEAADQVEEPRAASLQIGTQLRNCHSLAGDPHRRAGFKSMGC